ncbi:heme-binding protein, partial [Streptomyces sp. NPDC058583]
MDRTARVPATGLVAERRNEPLTRFASARLASPHLLVALPSLTLTEFLMKKILFGATAAAVVAAGTFGAVSANASAPAAAPAAVVRADAGDANLQQSTHLTIEAATKAAQATLDAAEKENQRVSVAVVDRNG